MQITIKSRKTKSSRGSESWGAPTFMKSDLRQSKRQLNKRARNLVATMRDQTLRWGVFSRRSSSFSSFSSGPFWSSSANWFYIFWREWGGGQKENQPLSSDAQRFINKVSLSQTFISSWLGILEGKIVLTSSARQAALCRTGVGLCFS